MEDEVIHSKIVAIASGKGGVGKTVVSASLGVGLSMLGKKVVMLDADFGGANLHKVMGIEKSSQTFLDFYSYPYTRLNEILIEHPYFNNLRLAMGVGDSMALSNLQYYRRMKFIRHLDKIDADFIILDLGAGSSYNVMDFFLIADYGIVMINPETLSILDGYNFVKKAFFRKLAKTFKVHQEVSELIKESASDHTECKKTVVKNLLEKVKSLDGGMGEKMEKFIDGFHPMLIINKVDKSKDENKGLAVMVAAKKMLSIEMKYLGFIHKDDNVEESVEENIPFIFRDSRSRASKDLGKLILQNILNNGKMQSVMKQQKLVKEIEQKWKEDGSDVI
ncbi:AAA family ATPase [bacterium]|nr:AAA family ATPase [bacterium]